MMRARNDDNYNSGKQRHANDRLAAAYRFGLFKSTLKIFDVTQQRGVRFKKSSRYAYTICFAGKMARNANHVRAQSGL